jgi:hypothetical protein
VALSELHIYELMLLRCYDVSNPGYKYYGKLGVEVCARWRECFENFLADVGPRPSPEHSIDRYPDPSGNYEPTNCRWATRIEQGRNKRKTMFVEIDGKRVTVAELIVASGLNKRMVYKRIRRGWSPERALAIPSNLRRNDADIMGVRPVVLVDPLEPAWKNPAGWKT